MSDQENLEMPDPTTDIMNAFNKIGLPIASEILGAVGAVEKVHIRIKYMTALLALYKTMALETPQSALQEIEKYVDAMLVDLDKRAARFRQMA